MAGGAEINITPTVGVTADMGVEATPTINLQAQINMSGGSSESNAEAWAVGERGGVPVTEPDQTYHNNSKYYAGLAGQDAETAEQASEETIAAATGKRDGEDVPETDPYYQNNAKYYSEQAALRATEAEGFTGRAKGHAEAAEEARTAAETAAQEAAETVVAAQGPGICYVDSEGIPFVLE